MKRVILDMDPGVDDALAIILAMLSPELKVEAITTVTGNVHVDLCTWNVLRIMEILCPETPPIIARGEAKPLAEIIPSANTPAGEDITGADVHGQDGMGNLDRFTDENGVNSRYPEPTLYEASSDHAVDVILSLIAKFPNEITLIPTGPLTNIAQAIIKDPEGMKKLREIIIMGGAFRVPGNATAVAEANILNDPQAADIVANSGLPITFVGLDVTHQVQMRESYIQEKIKPLNTKLSQFICDISGFYLDFYRSFDGIDGFYMHDPLAVGVAIRPELVETESLYVQVETQGKITAGMTVADFRSARRCGGSSNAFVCTCVDADGFLQLFMDTIKMYPYLDRQNA